MDDVTVTVVLLDVIITNLLQIGAAKLYGGRFDHFRSLIGSMVVAIHSGAIASGMIVSMDHYFVRTLVLIASGIIAFGCKQEGFWKTSLFLLLNAALEGTVNSHHMSSTSQRLAVTVVIVLLCCILYKPRKAESSYAHIEIRYRGKTVCVDAFRDTGNALKDLMTGVPVLVIGPDAAFRLTGLKQEELSSPLETIEKRPIDGLRLIPFSTVGNSHGLMLGVRSRDTIVDGIPTDMVIAMASEGMGTYEALIGGNHDTWDHQSAVKKIRSRKNIAPLYRRGRYTSFAVKG